MIPPHMPTQWIVLSRPTTKATGRLVSTAENDDARAAGGQWRKQIKDSERPADPA
jgi:hypothetical protein